MVGAQSVLLVIPAVKMHREMSSVPLTFLPFLPQPGLSHGMMLPAFQMGLPCSVKLLLEILSRTHSECDSQVM